MPSTRPDTRYAKSGDLNIAYQVVGDGPRDLIYVPGWISNVELNWEEPALAHVLERLASFSRLILFDKRGTGLSDPVPQDRLPTLEERMDDVRAVLDAVDSRQTAVFGFSEGGLMSVLFAATYPERTTALVLFGVFAKRIWSPDYPWAPRPDDREREIAELERNWSERMDVDQLVPSEDDAFKARLATYFRRSATSSLRSRRRPSFCIALTIRMRAWKKAVGSPLGFLAQRSSSSPETRTRSGRGTPTRSSMRSRSS